MSGELKSANWNFTSRALLPIILTGVAMAVLVAATLLFTTWESDQIARERQAVLLSHVLAEQVTRVSRDQESVAVWDDAIERTKQRFDADWIDSNLGIWMHSYYGHDEIFVLNERDEPVYAMKDGVRGSLAPYRLLREALMPLVTDVRRQLPGATWESSADAPRAADLVVAAGRPAIAGVMPILSDSGEIAQPAGSEFLHVSLRYLDGGFFDQLMREFLIEGAHFSWTDQVAANEASIPLTAKSGAVIGHFIWRPEQPGWRLLTRAAPALAVALVVVAGLIALLARRLRRASRELQASEAQAQHLAFHDPLTGLANRALFNDRLERALVDARRNGTRLALLYLDLDRFKNVNDTLGHAAGDDLIRALAGRLSEAVRKCDCVARLGGDEFAILIPDLAGSREVTALCERIVHAATQPFQLLGSSAFIGVSIGVALAPDAGLDRAELMRKADIALYAAKHAGGNRFRLFADEMDVTIRRRRELERELREALVAGNQFCIRYQPLYGAESGEIVGVEALLRWNHPKHGIIAPSVFVPIAEEAGLIGQIGEWVLREACRAGDRWGDRRIAVNVSPVQFRSPDFAAQVLRILQETGLDPARLELEITESVLLASPDLSAETIRALRAAGVRIALDDFGTGYSSLNYLQQFPVDRIKIDRSFVNGLDSTGSSDAIIHAMVDLARAMKVEVTAEGVETPAQREFLARIGCQELQGFLLSRPLPQEEIERMLGRAGAEAPQAVATAA